MNILNKLTLKHLKLNKRRTIVTIIGIILSTSLMVGIGLLLSTMRENMIDMVIAENGNRHMTIYDMNQNEYHKLTQEKEIQKIELAEYEVSMGKALKKVRIFLEKSNDTKIIEAINKMKESKSKYLVIKDIEDLKNKFHVNDAILKIAIGFEKDTIEKKVFCLTYGFECEKKVWIKFVKY